jgi:DNA repair exonuclease SbcCD ATPase subunit
MRDIQFHEVGMENYGPYIDPLILEFQNDSLTLVTGPNGIGKTMALDAILFTLYGITSRGMRGDDVVNNVVGRNCKTWVKFSIDSIDYTVTRYHKYSKLGNTVILNVGGVDSKKGHKEVVPEIDRILTPRKTFTNTLMFGQKVKDFFTDLTDSDKKEIFRQILNLEKYVSYYNAVSNKLKMIVDEYVTLSKDQIVKQELMEDAEEQIGILIEKKGEFENEKESELKDLEASLDKNLELKLQWDKKLDEQLLLNKVPDSFDVDKEIKNIEIEIDHVVTNHENECQKLSHQKELKLHDFQNKAQLEANKTKDEVNSAKDELTKEESALRDELDEFLKFNQEQRREIENLIIKFEMDASAHGERADELYKNVIDADIATCPTCDTDLTEEKIDKIKKKIKSHHDAIQSANESAAGLQENMDTLRKHLSEKSEEINSSRELIRNKIEWLNLDLSKKLKELDIRLNEAQEKVLKAFQREHETLHTKFVSEKAELDSKLRELQDQKESISKQDEKVNEIKEAIVNLKAEYDKLKVQYDIVKNKKYDETQLNSYRNKKIKLANEWKEIADKIKVSLKQKEKYEFWKGAYSPTGIPSMLIDEAIPFMNKKIAEYLEKLTNGRYVVSFDTLAATKAGEFRDKISVNVLDTFTRANSRVQLSGGQTRIIDIATILTLGDLQSNIQNMKINILVFDEIFDSLDDENIMQVSKVLNKLKIGKSIYLISHRHEDQLEADEVLAMQ